MLHRIKDKQWAAMLDIHLTAPFRMIQVTRWISNLTQQSLDKEDRRLWCASASAHQQASQMMHHAAGGLQGCLITCPTQPQQTSRHLASGSSQGLHSHLVASQLHATGVGHCQSPSVLAPQPMARLHMQKSVWLRRQHRT